MNGCNSRASAQHERSCVPMIVESSRSETTAFLGTPCFQQWQIVYTITKAYILQYTGRAASVQKLSHDGRHCKVAMG